MSNPQESRKLTAVWAVAAAVAIFFIFAPPAVTSIITEMEYRLATGALNTLGIKTSLDIEGNQSTEWGLSLSRFAVGLAILIAVYLPRSNRASYLTLALLLPLAIFAGEVSIVWLVVKAQALAIHGPPQTFYTRNGCFLLLTAVCAYLTRMKPSADKTTARKPVRQRPPTEPFGDKDPF